MTTVTKPDLAANVTEYLEKVEKNGEEILVTDHDIAIVKLVPVKAWAGPEAVFADVRGKVKYHADLLEPTTDEWSEV